MKQYASAGFKYPVITGETGADDALLKSFDDEVLGLVSAAPYTLDLESEANHRFVDGMLKNYNTIPGQYAALLYRFAKCWTPGLTAAGGDTSDREKFMAALKSVSLTDKPRGPIKFDHLNNVIGTIYIRRVVKEGAKYGLKLWNMTVSTPTRTSASSGRGRKRNFSPSRSIRVTTRR